DLWRKLDHKQGIAEALANLGSIAHRQGNDAEARSLYEESLTIRRNVDDRQGIAESLDQLGNMAHRQNDDAAAYSLYVESLTIRRELANRAGIMQSLENLAGLSMVNGHYERAVLLWGAAQALRDTIPVPRPPDESEEFDRSI